jgi:2-amino-4-hydroxy-6-hydroxymethyldihydropteridine diphosphokinase
MPSVYVSIGSNIDRERNIRGAVRALAQAFGALTLSSVYETEAVGFSGDPFYNLVAGFDTTATVEQVQEELKRIEAEHGRSREDAPRFSARTLDIDILLYGDLVRHDARVDIPRGEIAHHAFVLGPLAEIAPTLVLPEFRATVAELWRAMKETTDLRKAAVDLRTESRG